MLFRLLCCLLSFLFVASPVFAARQNLNEKLSRKARHSTNTFYSGESGSYYYHQPESMQFIDNTTSRETWIIVHKPDAMMRYSGEHDTKAFNADGSRIGFIDTTASRTTSNSDAGNYHFRWIVRSDGTKMRATEGYGREDNPAAGYGWANTEDAYYTFGGSHEGTNATAKLYKHTFDTNDVVTGILFLDTSGTTTEKKELIKNSPDGSDTWIVYRGLTYTTDYSTSDPNNDVQSMAFYFTKNDGSPTIDTAWGIGRAIGDVISHHNSTEISAHDNWLISNGDPAWVMIDYNSGNLFSMFQRTGHASDGGPAFEAWDGDSWGTNEEIRLLCDGSSFIAPYYFEYFGHPAPDMWGRYIEIGFSGDNQTSWKGTRLFDRCNYTFLSGYVLSGNAYDGNHHSMSAFSDYAASVNRYDGTAGDLYIYSNNYITGRYAYNATKNDIKLADVVYPGWPSTTAPTITNQGTPGSTTYTYSLVAHMPDYDTVVSASTSLLCSKATTTGHASLDETNFNRISWPAINGATSYNVYRSTSSGTPSSTGLIGQNVTGTSFDDTGIAATGTMPVLNYSGYPRPALSPDGTKVAFHSVFLNNLRENYPAIAYVVNQYPYPPEITQTTASSGTVTVRFDWQNDLSDENPRTYTSRGWPNESTSDRPIPRETKLFRLWVSSDNVTWSPVATVEAEPFTRFDFVNGGFKAGQDSYWEISTTQAVGSTRYYGITAQEHSGLESKALSNTWKVVLDGSGDIDTQAQQSAYPSDPGKMTTPNQSAFYTAFSATNNSKLIRYYNVYAKDGSAPSISQTTRIASISKNACSGGACSWVDWLGDTGGTTQYVVTAVDTQGNEGTALTVTATHQKSPATAEGQYTLEWSEPADESEAPVTNPHKGRFTAGAFSGSMR